MMVHLSRVAFAILAVNLVPALAAPADPPGTTITSAEPVSTPAVVPVAQPVTTPTVVVPVDLSTPTGLLQIAKFENDVGTPRVSGLAINIEMDIYWKGMSIAKTETESSLANDLEGLVPNSPPHYAAFSPTDPVTRKQGTAEMTTIYEDSTVASFNLHSFFYGCASKPESNVDTPLPMSCEITITGFNSTGEQVNQQTFEFEEDGAQQQMPKAVAKGFSGVTFVRFEIGPEDNKATAYIDTVHYEVFGS